MEAIIRYGFQFAGICGGVLAALFVLYKIIVEKKTGKLDKKDSYKVIVLIIILFFVVTVTSLWMYSPANGNNSTTPIFSIKHNKNCIEDEKTLCITGFGLPMQQFEPNSSEANTSAQEAAEMDADSKFLEKIVKHNLELSKTSEQNTVKSKEVKIWAKGMVNSGETVKVTIGKNGTCTVIVKYTKK